MSSDSSDVTKGVYWNLIQLSVGFECVQLEAVFLFQVEGAGGGSGAEQPARRGLEEEFNVQRARMKELFLQKEGS